VNGSGLTETEWLMANGEHYGSRRTPQKKKTDESLSGGAGGGLLSAGC